MPSSDQQIIAQVEHWLDQVVIGLNLCPFASKPRREKRLRIQVSHAREAAALLMDLQDELVRLDELPAPTLETTLLVIPEMLGNFYEYNQFLDLADALLREFAWEGHYQIASFHPHYCFAGAEPQATENLTNRSPYPILHLLREDSLEAALAHYAEPENIPARNIQRVAALSREEQTRLFPYLFL